MPKSWGIWRRFKGGATMAVIKRKREKKKNESTFESLVFPIKKTWLSKGAISKTRKSLVKKKVSALKISEALENLSVAP
jgi:hypothetical protein